MLNGNIAMAATYTAYHLLRKRAEIPRAYLEYRGVRPEDVDAWKIGFWSPEAPVVMATLGYSQSDLDRAGLGSIMNGRITLPMFDTSGTPLALIGRVMPGSNSHIKYLYPGKTPIVDVRSHIFGLHRLIQHFPPAQTPILVEGPLDVIVGQSYDLPMVSAHSLSFTQEQALLLRAYNRHEMIVMPDSDEEGQRILNSVSKHRDFLPERVKIAELPAGYDPAEYLRKHLDPDGLKELLDEAYVLN